MAKAAAEKIVEVQARIERDRAARVASLWTAPLLADSEIAEVLRLPYSTWQLEKARGDTPKLFNIGRRVYAMTCDVRAWLDKKAKAP